MLIKKISPRRGEVAFQSTSGLFRNVRLLLANDISNNVYNDFLVSETDYGKKLIEEACAKHPLNPKEVPRQRPGEDLAPIPVPNDTMLTHGARRQEVKTSNQAISTPKLSNSEVLKKEVGAHSEKAASFKRPVVPINSLRSAEIQQQASLSDDKKYKCHLCGKQFRVLLALKNHMVIRHDGAEVQLSSDSAPSAPANASAGQMASKQSSTKAPPNISLKRMETFSLETTSDERTALRSSLLDLWDVLGKEKWGREKYKHCRIYTEKEIRTLAENTKSGADGIRTAQESGVRKSSPIQPKPIPSYVPSQSTPINDPKPIAERSPSTASLPPGTFNPFASLASEDGTPSPIFEKSSATVTPDASAPTPGKAPVEIMVDGEKKYQCTICGKAFKTQIGLTGHFENKHPGQATGVISSGTTTDGGKHAIPVNLEDIPAYVPTPVDMSKFPGQGTGDVDPKAAALAEELRNTTVSLEQDVVVHARACTNITLSGIVVEMQSGYQGLIPVLQFYLLVEKAEHARTVERCGTQDVERTVHPPETIVIRVYGSTLVKRAQTSIREGNLVLVMGLLKLNPVPLGNRSYNNPYVTVSDGGGAVLTLV
ncbi:RNA editing complex protein MP63 [Perkinsela sp. CCAP 1560/4]|nr:RNA editing complex protein MP63 [Perkinsela sp. CCAP 1560/4]|eukprot:KNH07448.1 RNA editing complex protein MP63 [Perkinsela sp. CCAP 1560/4]